MKNYLLTRGPHVAAASYPSRHSMSAVLCQGQNRKGTGGGIEQRSHQSDYTNTSLWWHKGPWEVTGALLYTFGCLFMVNVGKYTIHGSYGYKELFLKYWVLLVPSVWVSNFRSARSGFWWVFRRFNFRPDWRIQVHINPPKKNSHCKCVFSLSFLDLAMNKII